MPHLIPTLVNEAVMADKVTSPAHLRLEVEIARGKAFDHGIGIGIAWHALAGFMMTIPNGHVIAILP